MGGFVAGVANVAIERALTSVSSNVVARRVLNVLSSLPQSLTRLRARDAAGREDVMSPRTSRGTDDHPTWPKALLARLHALARSSSAPSAAPGSLSHAEERPTTGDPGATTISQLIYDVITVDLAALTIVVDGEGPMHLPTQELILLVHLVLSAGRPVGEQQLREQLLHNASDAEGPTVRALVHQLRARLGTAGRLISFQPNRGYGLGLGDGPLIEES